MKRTPLQRRTRLRPGKPLARGPWKREKRQRLTLPAEPRKRSTTQHVRRRDRDVCQSCGADCIALREHVEAFREERATDFYARAVPRVFVERVAELAEVDPEIARVVLLEHRVPVAVDHITPLTDGGADTPDNMETLCVVCHREKTGGEARARARRARR